MSDRRPSRDDATFIRALLQGALFTLVRERTPGLVKVREVEQLADEDDNYLPYFTVVTESGIRIRVSVDVDSSEEDAIESIRKDMT